MKNQLHIDNFIKPNSLIIGYNVIVLSYDKTKPIEQEAIKNGILL